MMYAAISGGVMILLITVLRLIFLNRLPKWCFRLLWIFAALRLIIPFSFMLEVEVARDNIPTSDAFSQAQTVIIDTANTMVSDEPAATPDLDISDVIGAVIVLGAVVSAGFLTFAYIRMSRVARHADVMNKTDTGVSVRVGDGASTPFSCGVMRPIIFIPRQMTTLEDSMLNHIIAHELWHIKSGDQLVKWLLAAAVCLNWYNPLVWLMWRLACRDIELACDEAVVRHGFNNADYALTLIGAEEARMSYAVCSFGAPALNERIECIMKAKKLTVCGFIGAAFVLTVMSAFFIKVTTVQADGDTQAPPHVTISQDTYVPDDDTQVYVSDGYDTDGVKYELCVGEDGSIYVGEPSEEQEVCICEDESIYVSESSAEQEVCICEDESIYVSESSAEISLSCPLTEYSAITGHFGEQVTPFGEIYLNNGVNVSATPGADVYAAASGTVTVSEYDYSAGNYIVVDHGDGFSTVYRHLDKSLINVGDRVEAGALIGTVGQTGCVTGDNLGFAIIKDGAYLSPETLFE